MTEPDGNTAAELVQPGWQFDLRGAFLLRQEQLLATLGVGRSSGGHPVVVGDDSELNWRGMLESILPTRYRVSKGFAIDANGERSEQIDLLVYDRHFSPVLLEVGEHLFVPAEAVYAVLEVKQEMNRETIEYASGKVASVRRLRRTSAPVPFVEGSYRPKELQRILGGLLTMDSGWNPPLDKPFEQALTSTAGEGALDLGCALQAGSFEVNADNGSLARSEADTALIFVVLRLLKRLQRMASASAIVYDEYAQALNDPGEAGPSNEGRS